MAAIATLVEPFTSQNNTIWLGWSGNVTWTGSAVQVNCTSGYESLSTQGTWSLAGSSVYVQVSPTIHASGRCQTSMELWDGSYAKNLYWMLEGTTLSMGGTSLTATSITYSATDHKWWRIRESAGTVYWDTSPDGATWTNRKSAATAWAIDVYLQLKDGYWGAAPSPAPSPAVFDNVNVPSSTTHTATGAASAAVSLTGATGRERVSTGGLTALVSRTGVAARSLTATGALPLSGILTGVLVRERGATGALPSSVTLSGASVLTHTTAGSLALSGALTGAAVRERNANGVLAEAVTFYGTAEGGSSSTGSLTASMALTGALTASRNGEGHLASVVASDGLLGRHTGATGALVVTVVLSGAIEGAGLVYRASFTRNGRPVPTADRKRVPVPSVAVAGKDVPRIARSPH